MVSTRTDLGVLAARGIVAPAARGTAASERTLPLLPVFGSLLPQAAVQRGSVVSCRGFAAMSLACVVAAGPSAAGSWVGVVGCPALGLAAAAELGVSLERVVSVAGSASFTDEQWGDVVASLIDGFDVVVLGSGAQRVRSGTARRLVARAQARGAVLVAVEAPVFGADLLLEAGVGGWQGLGAGHGVATGRVVEVTVAGRRMPQQRRARWWLPAPDGQVRVVEVESQPQAVLPLRRTG